MKHSPFKYVNPLRLVKALGLDMQQRDVSEFNHSFLDQLCGALAPPLRRIIESIFYGTKYQVLIPIASPSKHPLPLAQHDQSRQQKRRQRPCGRAVASRKRLRSNNPDHPGNNRRNNRRETDDTAMNVVSLISDDDDDDGGGGGGDDDDETGGDSSTADECEEEYALEPDVATTTNGTNHQDATDKPCRDHNEQPQRSVSNGQFKVGPGDFCVDLRNIRNMAEALESFSSTRVPDPPRIQQLFFDLPPVLWVDIKRFLYDPHSQTYTKTNKAFAFDDRIAVDLLRNTAEARELADTLRQLKASRSGRRAAIHRCRIALRTVRRTLEYLEYTLEANLSESSSTITHDGTRDCIAHLERHAEHLSRTIDSHRDELDCIEHRLEAYRYREHSAFYSLHAVLVHRGTPSIGHYYAFIDVPQRGWVRFNDALVEQSSWEEMMHECRGGAGDTSAYCLVYVDRARMNAMFPPEQWQHLQSPQHLCDELKKSIERFAVQQQLYHEQLLLQEQQQQQQQQHNDDQATPSTQADILRTASDTGFPLASISSELLRSDSCSTAQASTAPNSPSHSANSTTIDAASFLAGMGSSASSVGGTSTSAMPRAPPTLVYDDDPEDERQQLAIACVISELETVWQQLLDDDPTLHTRGRAVCFARYLCDLNRGLAQFQLADALYRQHLESEGTELAIVGTRTDPLRPSLCQPDASNSILTILRDRLAHEIMFQPILAHLPMSEQAYSQLHSYAQAYQQLHQ